MTTLADQISTELRVLVGQPIGDCWRAANMQVFGFGPKHLTVTRQGKQVEINRLRLHVQCRWRMVDGSKILFGRDDLDYPADETVSRYDFDWDTMDSILDVARCLWFAEHSLAPPFVVDARGDAYGGLRIHLAGGFALEAFPCHSRRGEYSEHWRLFGHRSDDSHFVVTGHGIEDT